MESRRRFGSVACVAVLSALAACAGVKVSDRKELVTDAQRLPRPQHIYVVDFIATPEDLPAKSSLAGDPSVAKPAQTPQQIALGRQVGHDLAVQLAADIAAMGLPAEQAHAQPALALNDLMIRGYLLRVDAGSEAERIALGFGEGAAELKVAVEGFHLTENGLQKIGSGMADTSANKSPGAVVPLAVALASGNPIGLIVSTGVKVYDEESGKTTIQGKVKDVAKEIATLIRPRFEAQGWIPAAASAN